MPRRLSLPPSLFSNGSRRDRRLSVRAQDSAESPSHCSNRGYVRIKVSDFVTIQNDRLSQPRDALGPVDLAKRPPCYDLRTCGKVIADGIREIPEEVFEISDRQHIETLRNILHADDESVTEDTESSLQQSDQSEDNIELTDSRSIHHDTDEMTSDCEQDVAIEQFDELCEYDDESETEEPSDPEVDYEQDTSLASVLSIQDTIVSGAFSMSSFAASSGSVFPLPTSNVKQEEEESNPTRNMEEQPQACPVLVAVKTSEHDEEKKNRLPSFMQKKVPSPVRYTFRPLHRVPSRISEESEPNTVANMSLSTSSPTRKISFRNVIRSSRVISDSSDTEMQRQEHPPTLDAVKSTVEKIDPQAAMAITHVPPLALAAVGLFRRKRDSEESTWSKKSSTSSRNKRESEESNQSSLTEYYEDEYTRFIEAKPPLPRSPLRFRDHPYFAKVISHDGWALKAPRGECDSHSSVSVSTSDEEYMPHSNPDVLSNAAS